MMLSLPQTLVPIKMTAFTTYYSKHYTENFIPICNSNTYSASNKIQSAPNTTLPLLLADAF